MKGLVNRTLAAVAIVTTLAVGAPVVALASPTTTTTVATSPVITTMKQYRAAEKVYLAKLKVINLTFLAAVDLAKSTLTNALSAALNSTQRISARASYRFAITEATIARSNSLSILGKAPVKPGHKDDTTTTTI